MSLRHLLQQTTALSKSQSLRKVMAICSLAIFIACICPENQSPFLCATGPLEIWAKNEAGTGFYFITPLNIRKGSESPYKSSLMIMNERGRLLYYRQMGVVSDFKLQRNGRISYYCRGKFFITDTTLQLLDSVWCNDGLTTDSHDFLILPNGHYFLIGKRTYVANLSQYSLFLRRNATGSKTARVAYDVIQEYNADKQLVYEWDSRNYFKLEDANTFYLNDTSYVDVTHFNSLDIDAKGNLLISARFFDQIIKVNRSNDSIIWRLGGKGNTLTFLNDSLPFRGQHDARFTGRNSVSLFDNGFGYDSLRHPPRGLEYEIDDENKTAKLIWSHVCASDLVCSSAGSLQRLPGNRNLINYGKHNNPDSKIGFEMVSNNGQLLSQGWYLDSLYSYRTFFYAQLPFKLPTPEISCVLEKGHYKLSTKNTYRYYNWCTGHHGEQLFTKTRGSYFVDVSNDGTSFFRAEIKI